MGKREPQTIDYRTSTWGHGVEMWKKKSDGVYTCLVWHHTPVHVGDLLLVATDGPTGAAYFRVTEVIPLWDPDDMYKLVVRGERRWNPEEDH